MNRLETKCVLGMTRTYEVPRKHKIQEHIYVLSKVLKKTFILTRLLVN